MRQQMVLRIRIITGLVLFLALVLVFRLYQIQVVHGEEYTEKAESQYVHTKQDLYSRGSIYFTTKDGEKVSAASISSGYLLSFNPEMIQDAAIVCEKLLPYLSISKDRCINRATLPDRTYVEIETTLSDDVADKISDLDIDGVQLYRNQWRYYPGADLVARTIGFVGYSAETENELHGKYGLERYYDEVLFHDTEVQSVNFFAEIFSNLGRAVYEKDESPKGDVVTTIEPVVARMLSTQLQETNDKYQSKMTGAIIMDPKTGAIYAMDVVPGYNLNDRGTSTVEQFRNPLVEDVYEFGSTIKALTMAAGLDSGVITRDSTYYDAGTITLNSMTISNYDGRGRGTVPMQEILNQSLNTGVSYIAQKMGKDKFREYFLNFKLGSETGIDQPNEVYGLVDNLNSPREVEYATASFGQGIALTPIATIRALATLGNGGRLVTPHIASEVIYDNGTTREIRYPEGDQVLSERTSEEISRMLTIVVDDALANGKKSLPQHTIGAKTGTAQIANPNGGGYYDDRYLHSFFGYFPAFDPKFIVFMYTVEPKGVRYASETLTDPFMNIAKFLINYYTIPPDR
ncbi:MAG: penicillin-binding protein 2 [Candidatus Nomurabacteria bacterium]|nr:penicillin-binding protein 2 [Candidatus Nomurabacteria bacterium]USN87963.1 MAG: penicillin-binding protein 2 [Candidatus Nomurabacteria bacterium]